MRRILIVSPHFVPVNAPDMQRARMSLPGLLAAGWEVTVLTVDDPTPTAPTDPGLMATVPARTRIERAHCCSRRWTSWLGVNNVVLRSLPFLFLRGCLLLSSQRYDVVYFSTTMFNVLPLGRLWRRLYGVPYVIDLQDPWISDFYDQPGAPPPPGGWKFRVAQSLGRTLEGWTLRRAAHLIVVSAAYLDNLRERYPFLRHTPGTELPFGAPDADLALVRRQLVHRPAILPAGEFRLAFAGAVGPGMLPALKLLFDAMAELRRRGTRSSAHFYGTSYAPNSQGRPSTLALAVAAGVQDCVHETPDRLGYLDSLQVSLEAEVNLLFGSTDLAFIPSKTMAILAAGPPVLALAPTGSALLSRLNQLGATAVSFEPNGPAHSSIVAAAEQLLAMSRRNSNAPATPLLSQWGATEVASRQAAIFRAVSDAG